MTRAVDPGAVEHGAGTDAPDAVETVRRELAALPADTPVRLAKKTSNLFRFRDGRGGLAVDGLDHVLSVDPRARTADVGGMTTYEDLVARPCRTGSCRWWSHS